MPAAPRRRSSSTCADRGRTCGVAGSSICCSAGSDRALQTERRSGEEGIATLQKRQAMSQMSGSLSPAQRWLVLAAGFLAWAFAGQGIALYVLIHRQLFLGIVGVPDGGPTSEGEITR